MSNALPTVETVDPNDPRQALAPVLLALPFMKQTFTPPIDGPELGTLGDWSEELTKRGVRFHPELCELEFRPPPRGPQHAVVNQTYGWVDPSTPQPEERELHDIITDTTAIEKEWYAEQLRYDGIIPDREAPPQLAEGRVRTADETFNPKDHNVNYVLGYLHNAPDHEKRRVIAIEQTSKKPRKSILDKFPGV